MRLTFDDGPSSEWTPEILDALFDRDVQATFFVLGQHVAGNEDTLRRMIDEGHTIGVHGWSHRRLSEGPAFVDVRMELSATIGAIAHATGTTPTLWRAPYLDADERALGIAASLGLTHVGASMIPDDWMAVDPEAVARTVLAELRPDSVVCLHDGIPPDGGSTHCTDSRAVTVEAVRLILAGWPL